MFRLDDSPGFLLNKAATAMRQALEERLKAFGLTAPQWAVLARLWEEDCQPPSAIGKSLFFDKPTVTGVVDRLERKKLVAKKRDGNDGRVVRVCLTEKGRSLEEELPAFAKEVNASAMKGLRKDEAEALKSALKRVWANLKG